MFTIEQLVAQAKQDGASDIHLICGLPPKYRVSGHLENMSDIPLSAEDCILYAKTLAGKEYSVFEEAGELDTAESYAAYLESAEIKPDAKTCRESVTEFELNHTFEKMCGDIKALYDACID